ncbi:MAG: hypothetical protein MN733_38080 [Nitrososphaera sp.]|nr:hypothetical protein [Nitrososphaera sp.]
MTSTELILTGWELWDLSPNEVHDYFLDMNEKAWDEWHSISTDNVGIYG